LLIYSFSTFDDVYNAIYTIANKRSAYTSAFSSIGIFILDLTGFLGYTDGAKKTNAFKY